MSHKFNKGTSFLCARSILGIINIRLSIGCNRIWCVELHQ